MDPKIAAGFAKAGVAHADRHLFLCIGPDCCEPADGERVWEYVKRRVREAGLRAMRTKAGCFRICSGGPWLVVYPDGVWYGQLDEQRFERILLEHLIGGTPVAEWVIARNAMRELRCASSADLSAQSLDPPCEFGP
jgi:(2Fe-2S) ferredoxin